MQCPKCKSENPDESVFCAKCGTQITVSEEIPAHTKTLEAPKEELTRGTTFASRYEIIEELGRGGMGKVFKAYDKQLKEEVALKLINPEIASDKKTVDRFSNELKIARKIVHKNVGRMYELMEDKRTYFITMEYVSGQDLKGMIRQAKQLTVGTTLSIAKQVADGLAEAHKLGVAHRDLKPSNIMIDKDGDARIMDFGIARSVASEGITDKGVMIGTPDYMSPEQVEGKDIDQRTDIYSLGVILYEMVTGKTPFEGETALSIAHKHKYETPKEPQSVNTQVPDDLNSLILKCLEKDKVKRYQSAGEVRSELESIEKGMPTTDRVIPERKPLTSREITVTLGLKKALIPVIAIVALAILAVIIWRPWSKKVPSPIPSDKPSLAVMYFENNTGDENLNHYRKAIPDLLITDLSQSKHLRVLSGSKLYNILKELNLQEEESYSSKDLEEVAIRGGVKHVLLGSYTKAGDTYRISINLQEASTAELVASEGIEGKGEESIFSMVDELTQKIKMNFKLSQEQITNDLDRNVGQITTSSPEAYKYYVEASERFDNGEYKQAIQMYEKAISIDPEFATAYRSMAMAYSNMRYDSEKRKYVQKAFEYSHRVSDRERYRNQAEYYSLSEKTYDKAIEAYDKLLELYPEETAGRNNLGLVYIELEQWDKATEQFELAIQKYKDKSFTPYLNLADTYMARGMYDKAREILELYINDISDHPFIHMFASRNYAIQMDYVNALREVDRAIALNPDFPFFPFIRGNIFHYRSNWIKAEEEYRKLLDSNESSARVTGIMWLVALDISRGKFAEAKDQVKQGIELTRKFRAKEWERRLQFVLSYLHHSSGDWEEALKEIDKARNIAIEDDNYVAQRRALYLKGIQFLQGNLVDEAIETAAELEKLIQAGTNKKSVRLYHHLLGMIELKNENFSSAIELFNKAISLMPFQWDFGDYHAIVLEPLAIAYYRSADFEKAQEAYEKITDLTTGRLHYGDIYAKAFYMLGKIHEQRGNTAKAIEHYGKFLDLWKDADPGIAEVDDARKRLAGLKPAKD